MGNHKLLSYKLGWGHQRLDFIVFNWYDLLPEDEHKFVWDTNAKI
jgi:hypothetical protein